MEEGRGGGFLASTFLKVGQLFPPFLHEKRKLHAPAFGGGAGWGVLVGVGYGDPLVVIFRDLPSYLER